MFDWLDTLTASITSVVVGILVSLGIATSPPVSAPTETLEPSVTQASSTVAISSSIQQKKQVDPVKKDDSKASSNSTKADTHDSGGWQDLNPTPDFTLLFNPKPQYTAEEIHQLNEEVITYFKTYNSCYGLFGTGLTYCQTFESSPQIQLFKSMLLSNARSDAEAAAKAAPASADTLEYRNATMGISNLDYPKGWLVVQAPNKTRVIFYSPDFQTDIALLLYLNNTSLDLQTVLSDAQQAAKESGVTITNHQSEKINGKTWLIYDYDLTLGDQTTRNRNATFIFPGSNGQAILKVQLESFSGDFSNDSTIFQKILSSLVLSD